MKNIFDEAEKEADLVLIVGFGLLAIFEVCILIFAK